jgi:murein DD-endopeptidase MepM/ murein hydrolase activator NlpD
MFDKFRKFLLSRIKINALSPDTYEPFFGVEITRLTIFSGIFIFFILASILTYFILSFTPMKAFLPDSLRTADKELLIEQQLQIDSLAYQIQLSQQYADDLKATLKGQNSRLNEVPDSMPKVQKAGKLISTEVGDAEKELMEKIQDDLNENSGITEKENNQYGLFFFAPVKGVMSQKMSANHPAVDIVTKAGEPVKSILDGRVIFSEFSKTSGFTMIIYHNSQFISVYKHLQTTNKKSGDRVKVGEVIGLVGNSGTHSSGPHLHFELIFEGRYVNPTDFISFK